MATHRLPDRRGVFRIRQRKGSARGHAPAHCASTTSSVPLLGDSNDPTPAYLADYTLSDTFDDGALRVYTRNTGTRSNARLRYGVT